MITLQRGNWQFKTCPLLASATDHDHVPTAPLSAGLGIAGPKNITKRDDYETFNTHQPPTSTQLSCAGDPYPAPPVTPSAPILDHYLESAPSPQNALSIFQGEWSSKLPAPFADCQAGSTPLFEDARIQWFVDAIGGVQGKTVLELGSPRRRTYLHA